jgi:hypothetical protein
VSVRAIADLERGRTKKPYPSSVKTLVRALGLPEAAGTDLVARYRAGDGAAQADNAQAVDADEAAEANGGVTVPRQLWTFHNVCGHWHDGTRLHRLALDAARRRGDLSGQEPARRADRRPPAGDSRCGISARRRRSADRLRSVAHRISRWRPAVGPQSASQSAWPAYSYYLMM